MSGVRRSRPGAARSGHIRAASAGGAAATAAPVAVPWASPDQIRHLVTVAGRAPSVHNTQPWRFRVTEAGIELRADPRRRLPAADPSGREMLISCGAALFGLRLGVRSLGRLAVVQLLPEPEQPGLLARVRLGEPEPARPAERALLAATYRRHTHRGPFGPEPLPAGMLAALQRDAEAEGGTLVLIDRPGRQQQLAALVAAGDRRQRLPSMVPAELRHWTRPPDSDARDGVPARAYPAVAGHGTGLAPRDFDLGRGWGRLDPAGPAPVATAVLTTGGDGRADWLRAGQALHRVLLRAAGRWVFASLHTQPLESAPLRAAVRTRLALPGAPQMLLQFGRSGEAPVTARRPAEELLTWP
jgi:nitroreductase